MTHWNKIIVVTGAVTIFNFLFLSISSKAFEVKEIEISPPDHSNLVETYIDNDHQDLNEIDTTAFTVIELNPLVSEDTAEHITHSPANPLLTYQTHEKFNRYLETTLALVPIGLLVLDMTLPSGGFLTKTLSWFRNTFLCQTLALGISSTIRWLNWKWYSPPNTGELHTHSLRQQLPLDPFNLQALDVTSNVSFLLCYLTPLTVQSYYSTPLFSGMMIVSSLFAFRTGYMIKNLCQNNLILIDDEGDYA